MTTTDTEDRIRKRPTDEDVDIYNEDGNVRSDFLARLGAAIADRDTLFLRQNVARLHESEIVGIRHFITINPESRHIDAAFRLFIRQRVTAGRRAHEEFPRRYENHFGERVGVGRDPLNVASEEEGESQAGN